MHASSQVCQSENNADDMYKIECKKIRISDNEVRFDLGKNTMVKFLYFIILLDRKQKEKV